jgi:hypothetical protein
MEIKRQRNTLHPDMEQKKDMHSHIPPNPSAATYAYGKNISSSPPTKQHP